MHNTLLALIRENTRLCCMTHKDQLAKMIDDAIAKTRSSQREVARLAEVDVSSLSRWRRGHQRCPAYRVEKLALALRLDAAETETMRDLALKAEAEEHKNKAALRSLEARRDIDQLQQSVKRLEDRVTQLEKIVGLAQQSYLQ